MFFRQCHMYLFNGKKMAFCRKIVSGWESNKCRVVERSLAWFFSYPLHTLTDVNHK